MRFLTSSHCEKPSLHHSITPLSHREPLSWANRHLRFFWNSLKLHPCSSADVAELADALDSKSSDRKVVWVRSPPSAGTLYSMIVHAQLHGARFAWRWLGKVG